MRQLIPPLNLWFLPALVVRVLLYLVVRFFYAVEVGGKEFIPQRGPVLLVANHASFVDVLLLQLAYPRPIHFVAHEYLFRIWWLGWFLRLMGVVAIQPRNARQAFRRAGAKLREGRVVCLFPEGQLSQTGFLQRLKPGFKILAEQAGCPVQPVAIDGIWGSRLSFAQGCFWGKRPLPFRPSIRLQFGPILPPDETLLHRTRQSLLDLAAEAFSLRPPVAGGLAGRIIRSLAHRPWRRQLMDCGPTGRDCCSRGRLLGMAIAHSRLIRSAGTGFRVGGSVPAGILTTSGHLALLLAGRAPAAGDAAGVLTEAMLRDLPKWRVQLWVAVVYLLPGRLLAWWLSTDPSAEASSLGVGVDLLSGVNLILTTDCLLRQRPTYGLVDFWHPLAAGIPMVTGWPSGPEAGSSQLVGPDAPTAVSASADFLRQCVKEDAVARFAGVRFVVTGPERLETDLRMDLERKFGFSVFEEIRLGEAIAPFCLNVPDAPKGSKRREAGARAGSAGRLLPGFTARVVSPEGHRPLSLGERGRLLLKGPGLGGNYSVGAFGNGRHTAETYFDTGLLGRFDEDGFVFIEEPGTGPGKMDGAAQQEPEEETGIGVMDISN